MWSTPAALLFFGSSAGVWATLAALTFFRNTAGILFTPAAYFPTCVSMSGYSYLINFNVVAFFTFREN